MEPSWLFKRPYQIPYQFWILLHLPFILFSNFLIKINLSDNNSNNNLSYAWNVESTHEGDGFL